MATQERTRFHFSTGAYPDGTLLSREFRGQEQISHPYHFEIELASKQNELDLDSILQHPARLQLDQPSLLSDGAKAYRQLPIHGILASLEQLGKIDRAHYRYRAVLVPRLWKLSLQVQCRVFLEKTVPQIVEEVLRGNGFEPKDFEINTSREYISRDYTIQYYESDLCFLSRLTEHEGMYFYFKQEEDREKLVFQDSGETYPAIVGDDSIPYSESATDGKGAGGSSPEEDWSREAEIHEFVYRKVPVQTQVVLKDYNWRKPSLNLETKHPVAETVSFGSSYEYGNNFRTPDQGKLYAQIRAEEIACRQSLTGGRSSAKSLSAGHRFTLQKHWRQDFNRDYLLTEVTHHGSQSLESDSDQGPRPRYHNEFVGMSTELAFRPERKTPKPKASGAIHAKVDASGDGKYAEIDDEGRYKIQVPFDLSGKDKGKASCFVRMSQPYSGEGMGMHFPLHKGTEVMLAHIDGDPDRPIITGSVPNRETPSPVTGANQTQSAIHTGGGNKLIIEDTDGKQRIHMSSPGKKTTFTMGQS